jgi:hypothetical protein
MVWHQHGLFALSEVSATTVTPTPPIFKTPLEAEFKFSHSSSRTVTDQSHESLESCHNRSADYIVMDVQSSFSATASTSRKRERENETPSQRHKREKAAERQRRKRERDRNNNSSAGTGRTGSNGAGIMFSQPSNQQHMSQAPPPDSVEPDLSPEEKAKQDRVRSAARERQRKHRALVKERKMRELGLDMGNEIPEVQYRVGQYQQVSEHELQHNPHGVLVHHEPPFLPGQEHEPLGQHFASTLLLSITYTPTLRHNLLANLQMTNEELASFQPIIAEAWDHWDHQVCLCPRAFVGPTLNITGSVECITHKQQKQPNLAPYQVRRLPTHP